MPSSSASLPRYVRLVWAGMLDLIYPTRCLGCAGHTGTPADPLCQRCVRLLERADPAQVTAALHSFPALDAGRSDGFALWLFDKGGTLQRVQHALKYGNRPRYGVALGRLIGTAMQHLNGTRPDLIVPVPLHRTRLLERGYNQSTQLARGLADTLDRPVREDVLQRLRPTRSQTHLSREERWTNVADAFATPHPAAVEHRRVLLVDDVLTTGATAAAAAHVLLHAGAAHVRVVTLALAR